MCVAAPPVLYPTSTLTTRPIKTEPNGELSIGISVTFDVTSARALINPSFPHLPGRTGHAHPKSCCWSGHPKIHLEPRSGVAHDEGQSSTVDRSLRVDAAARSTRSRFATQPIWGQYLPTVLLHPVFLNKLLHVVQLCCRRRGGVAAPAVPSGCFAGGGNLLWTSQQSWKVKLKLPPPA